MIQLLDCSLRDGGYINNWQFGESEAAYLIKKLTDAGVDYVEAGFLNDVLYKKGSTNFSETGDTESVLAHLSGSVNLALMVRPDRYDAEKLASSNGKIRYIRIAFYRKDLQEAIRFSKAAVKQGYRVFFNMVNTAGYTLDQLRETVTELAKVNPYAVTIVDTFGCMNQEDLLEKTEVLNACLPPSVKLAFHPHNNMLMAYPLAQSFIKKLESCKRDGIVDGSLLGIGRKPGNLPTELIAGYLNSAYGAAYGLEEMLSVIEKVIDPIKRRNDWGYSAAYMLGAAAHINRNYVEYFLEKGLSLEIIKQAIALVPAEKGELYHPAAAEMACGEAVEKWKASHCAFRMFYKYPVQKVIGKRSVYDLRYEAGRLMASSVPEKVIDSIDYIIPVPDTGIAYADGLSKSSGIRLIHALKKSGVRTFFMDDLRAREASIEAQIQIDETEADLRGKRVALIDEAIFSGVTLRIICRKLRALDVAEITVIIPIGLWRKQCPYHELPDYTILCDEMSSDHIAHGIGADRLFVQDTGKLRAALQRYDCDLCYSCFCPTSDDKSAFPS